MLILKLMHTQIKDLDFTGQNIYAGINWRRIFGEGFTLSERDFGEVQLHKVQIIS